MIGVGEFPNDLPSGPAKEGQHAVRSLQVQLHEIRIDIMKTQDEVERHETELERGREYLTYLSGVREEIEAAIKVLENTR